MIYVEFTGSRPLSYLFTTYHVGTLPYIRDPLILISFSFISD